jgi:hypothetical protein
LHAALPIEYLDELKYFTNLQSIGCFNGTSVYVGHVTIPVNVINFGWQGFHLSTVLRYILFPLMPPELNETRRNLNYSGRLQAIYVPDESLALYKESDDWGRYSAFIRPLSEYTG